MVAYESTGNHKKAPRNKALLITRPAKRIKQSNTVSESCTSAAIDRVAPHTCAVEYVAAVWYRFGGPVRLFSRFPS